MNDTIVKGIFEQLEGEANAQSLYADFLADYPTLRAEDRAVIQEIMQDEQNHSIRLLAMARRYGNDPASPDGLAEAISELVAGVQ